MQTLSSKSHIIGRGLHAPGHGDEIKFSSNMHLEVYLRWTCRNDIPLQSIAKQCERANTSESKTETNFPIYLISFFSPLFQSLFFVFNEYCNILYKNIFPYVHIFPRKISPCFIFSRVYKKKMIFLKRLSFFKWNCYGACCFFLTREIVR